MRTGYDREAAYGAGHDASAGPGGVDRFAAEVVARLVAREARVEAQVREDFLEKFMTAVLSPDPRACDALRPEMRRARIGAIQMADDLIPETARRLGLAWEDDRASFAQVTLGAVRLQAMVREVGASWSADGVTRVGSGLILLVVPDGEQHTLGASVATSWLRRQGLSVCLRIGPTAEDLRHLVSERRFDGAMLSLGSQDNLDTARDLVKILKIACGDRLPVAVGGAILDEGGAQAGTIGADLVTNDLGRALDLFGLGQAVTSATGRD
jgi:methanogenic corrinoid protein MtbC1